MKVINTLNIIVLAIIVIFANASTTNWCNVSTCPYPNEHTLCQYYPKEVNYNRCGVVMSSSLDDDDIDDILSNHNSWRQYVGMGDETLGNPGPQPAAKNLQPMTWNKELARIAQTWANQCIIDHDACRDTDDYRVGQNIACVTSSGNQYTEWRDVMIMWYDEVVNFNGSNVNSYPAFGTADTANYTQIMWQNSTTVGCGGIRFDPDGQSNKTFLVCNYGPTGNIVGEPVYIID